MSKQIERDDTSLIVKQVIAAMQDKKAKNIVSIDLSNIPTAVTKYFVICHAPSKTQVNAIHENIMEFVRMNCDTKPFNREGYENSEWILIDYFDVVVHIFRDDIRSFYKLEELWADAVLKEYESDD